MTPPQPPFVCCTPFDTLRSSLPEYQRVMVLPGLVVSSRMKEHGRLHLNQVGP